MIYNSTLFCYFVYIRLVSFLLFHFLNYRYRIHSIFTPILLILLSYIVVSYIIKIMRIMCRFLFFSCFPIKWCFTYCTKHIVTSLYFIYITVTFWALLTFFNYLLCRYYVFFFTLMKRSLLFFFIAFSTYYCFTYYTF